MVILDGSADHCRSCCSTVQLSLRFGLIEFWQGWRSLVVQRIRRLLLIALLACFLLAEGMAGIAAVVVPPEQVRN